MTRRARAPGSLHGKNRDHGYGHVISEDSAGVLRQAMATDALQPSGVYFGTGGGELYASADEGEHWSAIARHLPAISSVETYVAS